MDTVLVFDNHSVSINSVIIFFSKCTLYCVLVFLFVTIVVLYVLYVNKNKIRKKKQQKKKTSAPPCWLTRWW